MVWHRHDSFIPDAKIWNQSFPFWKAILFAQKVNGNPMWCRSKSNCLVWKVSNFYRSNPHITHTNVLSLKELFFLWKMWKVQENTENTTTRNPATQKWVSTLLCVSFSFVHVQTYTLLPDLQFTIWAVSQPTFIFHSESWAFSHVIKYFLTMIFLCF